MYIVYPLICLWNKQSMCILKRYWRVVPSLSVTLDHWMLVESPLHKAELGKTECWAESRAETVGTVEKLKMVYKNLYFENQENSTEKREW